MSTVDEYSARVASEVNRFAGNTFVHNLPSIFHYWSDTYVRPKLNAIGFDSVTDLFTKPLAELCRRQPQTHLRFVSIGAGNCDFELDVAKELTAAGHTNFIIDCLDLNASMLERGAQAAAEAGHSAHIAPLQGDFNHWQPAHEYDAILAAQALHHVLNLEGLFAQIKASLKPHSLFITSDMIGRNGHERWPEALEAVQHFWHRLPPSYRYNWQLRRYEDAFQDWNCAGDSFEGIRAQDILPLLIENFHFAKFAAFGNVIDPFVDRSFGPNLRAHRDADRAFIDEVHAFDERSFRDGALSPTHLFAVMTKQPDAPTICAGGLAPEHSLRREPMAPLNLPPNPPLHLSEPEVELSHILLSMEAERKRLESQVRVFHADHSTIHQELKARTDWALDLEKQLNERTEWALSLDKEVAARTKWAQSLDAQNAELTKRLSALGHAPKSSFKAKLKRLLGR